MKALKVTLETVTPLFLGGANLSQEAEFRLPSLKGVLRFWYRAIDPEFRLWEDKLFGSAITGAGQSRFLLRLEQPKQVIQGNSINKRREISYFTFPFRKKDRRYLEINQPFVIYFVRRPVKTEEEYEDWKRLLATLWIFSAIGGLGSRSRRGFGSVRIKEWQAKELPEVEPLMQSLPILANAQTADEWKALFHKGVSQIQSWFSAWKGEPTHTIVSSKMRCFIGKEENSWLSAMQKGANLLAEYRQKVAKNDRPAFGLPMIIQYRNKSLISEIKLKKECGSRMASPVWFRVSKIGKSYYPVFALLQAPLPNIQKVTRPKEQKGQKRTVRTANLITEEITLTLSQVYDQFAEHLKSNHFTEVTG